MSFHLQRDSLQRYKSLDRKSISFRHPSFRMSAGHRRSFDESAPQGMQQDSNGHWFNRKATQSLRCLCETAEVMLAVGHRAPDMVTRNPITRLAAES